MIEIKDKKLCSGCSACFSVCPKHCITMQADEEGFLYPFVDNSSCIDCHLCEKKCPVLHPFEKRKPIVCYAAQNKDELVRMTSSSGGAFTTLATTILDKGGIVCGVEFDKDKMTHHICIQSKVDLKKLIGSKYVQSRLENVFKEIKGYIQAGQWVLFTGTPCQVAGINSYLGNLSKAYNYISVELCCHGAPSPLIWKKYLEEIGVYDSKIQNLTFRSKENGWKNYSLEIQTDRFRLCEGKEQNIYMKGFLNSLYCRPICSECKARGFATNSDLSIGDFWGLPKFYPDKDDNKGKNLMLILSDKGHNFYKEIKNKLEVFEIKYEEVIAGNTNYLLSSTPHVKRPIFWKYIASGKSIRYSVERCLRLPLKLRFKNFIKKICKK
mgnify:FL=1